MQHRMRGMQAGKRMMTVHKGRSIPFSLLMRVSIEVFHTIFVRFCVFA